MNPTRRGFLRGVATFLAAPAIVRVANIMPVKAFEVGWRIDGLCDLLRSGGGQLTVEHLREAMRIMRANEVPPILGANGRPYYAVSIHPQAAALEIPWD